MNILFVCHYGKTRSGYLAKYLRLKGYSTDYGGIKVDGYKPLSQEQVDWADIIVIVRKGYRSTFLKKFNPKGKEIICLHVWDLHPKKYSEDAQKVLKKDRKLFRKKYVYPELRKQIKGHMHKFK